MIIQSAQNGKQFHISYFAALFKMSTSRIYAQTITQKKGKGKEKREKEGWVNYRNE